MVHGAQTLQTDNTALPYFRMYVWWIFWTYFQAYFMPPYKVRLMKDNLKKVQVVCFSFHGAKGLKVGREREYLDWVSIEQRSTVLSILHTIWFTKPVANSTIGENCTCMEISLVQRCCKGVKRKCLWNLLSKVISEHLVENSGYKNKM